MARVLLALVLVPIAVLAGPVPSCAPGTLIDYINLGSDGCSVGDKLFFDFTELTIPSGSTAIDSAIVAVTPVDTALLPELRFTINVTAGAGQFLDTRFAYSITSKAFVAGLRLQMTGATAFGDGAATVIEDACLGDVFFFDLCFNSTASLITFATEFDAQTSEQTTFPPTRVVGIANDIGIDGGQFGRAALGTVINQISEIPEPATGSLFTIGFLAVAWLRRRR